jgi:hypothetical protein
VCDCEISPGCPILIGPTFSPILILTPGNTASGARLMDTAILFTFLPRKINNPTGLLNFLNRDFKEIKAKISKCVTHNKVGDFELVDQ